MYYYSIFQQLFNFIPQYRFENKKNFSLTEITVRIRDTLMQNLSLPEILS